MKKTIQLLLFLGLFFLPNYQYANKLSNGPKEQLGNYTLVVEGFDWGPGANKVILALEEKVSKVQKKDYSIAVQKSASCSLLDKPVVSAGNRTILYAYVSDAKGTKMTEGKHVTLVLLVAPNMPISSPMQYLPQCGGNIWTDYALTITNTVNNKTWDTETNRIHPLVDEFDLTGKFVYNKELTLTYAAFTPNTPQEKIPLIIWLHGGGEGGVDPSIPLMANRAANYAAPEIQSFFNGAYVLVPQTPTFWMDDGTGNYTRGRKDDFQNKPLMALIQDYIAKHPKVDTDRIYVGGCSNGGYMSLKLMLNHPDYFAASFPSALAYHAEFISAQQIESIKEMPIWFIHSEDDPVTKAAVTVDPIYEKLIAVGAKDVHYSKYDHVVDVTGFYGGDNFHYLGHFSWIYSHANLCRLDFDGQPVMLNGRAVTLMEWLAGQSKN